MALAKTATSLYSSQTLTAGASNINSSSVNLSSKYGATVLFRLTNGGTGPTVAARVQVEVSPDNSSWFDYGGPFWGSLTNSAVSEGGVEIGIGNMYVRVTAGGNTGQNVTLDAVVITIDSL